MSVPSSPASFNPALEPYVSSARLATYRAIARDDDHAWALYRWNQDLVAALGPIGCDLEVTLRNVIHNQLSTHFGRNDWWANNEIILDDVTAGAMASVVKKHQRDIVRGRTGPGKVVADLMLGTWVMLLGRGGVSELGRTVDYERQLWQPALRFGFATGTLTKKDRTRRPTREAVHLRASNFQRLRNRCAHHEPIANGILISGTKTRVPLMEVWQGAIELLGWTSPELATYHQGIGALPLSLAARPA